MNEKIICKVIQDLLPNYIESLTNEQTNKFIEGHFEKCEKCKNIIENMQKEIKTKNLNREKKEIKYIKKYNKKLKILRNTISIIIALFIFIVTKRTIILTNLSNKAKLIEKEDNYYIKIETYNKGNMSILEGYFKDGKSLKNLKNYNDNKIFKRTVYKDESEEAFENLIIDQNGIKNVNLTGNIEIEPKPYTYNNIFENIIMSIITNVEKVNLNGKECYIIKDRNGEKFIEESSGLVIKEIDNKNNITVDYTYKYGIVTDNDIVKPSILNQK